MEQEKDKVEDKETLDNQVEIQTEAEAPANEDGQETASPTGQLAAQLNEAKDKYLRLYADFENFRRRTAKEKTEFLSSAQADLLKALLPVLDDFQRAQKAMTAAQDVTAVREGVELIYQKFYRTLEQKGLKPMEAIGKDFDAELHESIAQVPVPEEGKKGKVIDEVEKGYYLNDKVLRFAKVIVGA